MTNIEGGIITTGGRSRSQGDTWEGWKRWIRPWMPPILVDLPKKILRHSARARGGADVREQRRPFILPVRTLKELFPGIEDVEVSIAATQICRRDEWLLPLTEILILSAICKHVQPRRIFEIGTYTGSSVLAMAMNTPSATELITLDLDPSQRDMHKHGLGVGGLPAFTVGLFYRGTSFEKKIHQLHGNSFNFDYSPFYEGVDLVFIDADHTYDFVKADTENAFKLIRPGGIIIWDDYRWDDRHPECTGVTQRLNELTLLKPCFQIEGTRFAIYRDPQGSSVLSHKYAAGLDL